LRNSKAVYAAWLECTCEVPGARQAQKSGGDLVIGNIRVKAWDPDEVLLSEIVLLIPIIVIRLPNHCGHWRHSKLTASLWQATSAGKIQMISSCDSLR
jgi:hypothetical protein